MRVIIVIGARPNFVKVGPLVPALTAAGISADLVHTGQHYDAAMSDVFFEDLRLPEPRWYLGVGSGTHATQTAAAMVKLEELLSVERPDALVVVGDVNSTLAGALAAVKLHVPVVHVEAGLRSRDFSMPEEVNRLVTDQLSALLLTPVREADENLKGEGIDPARIRFVGNVMAESVLEHLPQARERRACERYGLARDGYVLATIHRPENTDHPERLAEIAAALRECPLPVLFPVHPRTRPRVAEHGLVPGMEDVILADPVGYLDMLSLQADAAAVVTDSGGVQEEACMLHTPCVTVRRSTERRITIEVGANRLVGAWRDKILAGLDEALASMRDWPVPELWDDQVSSRIAQALLDGVEPLPGV
ncbi:UDP-N-acetylglucosamine 2-epimerase (non-hydrolyzing) [Coriobacteriia bacterium Es71-Z0120]|uniref:non-hydrolyzing UDP-N-acetylglucosamine 2-epimerase n=1 Tax=Parvivirga hydrogeniphila TaxID=2939460 RepID=UPI002260B4F6|nr:UDP-N-acetylglucosamine 2-epimerase (non-hydrolyzing) [Parvivirga hydrogeniphila]MCL4079023.1 UDP-N-acetylglucosamine 2-epimerase (non-hydrolyzing) [Parvivirga hydrogeniphila]